MTDHVTPERIAEIRVWADRVCLDERHTREATDEEAMRVTDLLMALDSLASQVEELTKENRKLSELVDGLSFGVLPKRLVAAEAQVEQMRSVVEAARRVRVLNRELDTALAALDASRSEP